MSETNTILKGNFKTKKDVRAPKENSAKDIPLAEKLKKQALASLGGSMVYMERKKLSWDGERE